MTTEIKLHEAISNTENLLDILAYSSYSANRNYGMTHEQLMSIGLGNEGMKVRYETNNFTKQLPIE